MNTHSQRLREIVQAMDALMDVGAEHAPISTVLRIADPESRLRKPRADIAAAKAAQAAEQPVADPRMDPVTGCLPVTPP